MQLESLKSSKFEAFKGDEINNPLPIKGGYVSSTYQTTGGSNPGGGIDFYYTGNQVNGTLNAGGTRIGNYDVWFNGPCPPWALSPLANNPDPTPYRYQATEALNSEVDKVNPALSGPLTITLYNQ